MANVPASLADRTVKVAILETEPSGHRMHYVRFLVDAVGPAECVVLTSDRAAGSEEFAEHLSSAATVTVALPETDTPRVALSAAVERAVAAGVRKLIVPDGDVYLVPLLFLLLRHPRLTLEVRLLIMRTTAANGPERLRPATLVKPVLAQLVRAFRQVRIMFLTDAFGVVRARPGYPGIPAVKDPVIPDGETIYDRPAWLPRRYPGHPLVGILGVITPRKNLPLLVEAMELCPSVTLVVGGPLRGGTREFVDTDENARRLIASGRLVIADRLFNAAEVAAALAHVDVVAVMHGNDAPSAILAQACVRHTPVLVPDGGWLARVVATTGVGVATALTATAVAEAIHQVIGDQQRYIEAARAQSPHINTSDFTELLLGG
jgi:glycosyltransferase involved in cell wall biosynthesis